MFAPYRRLFSAKGSVGFTTTGFLARLALSMSGVGTVVMVAAMRHSYALAGAVGGSSLAATLITIPLLGRLVDRYGQSRTAIPAAIWSAAMSAALVICLATDAPTWTLFVTNVLSATAPNVGGMARARWAELYGNDDERMHVANSFEQVLDEMCFVLGPIIVVGLATGIAPEAGRIAPLILTLGGTVLFSLQRGTEPPVQPADPSAARSPLTNRGLQVMMLVFLFTGSLFGSLEVVTIAFTDSLHHKSSAGLVLALQAVGSALAGLLFGMLTLRGSSTTRFLMGVGGMAVLMLPLTLASGLWSLVPLMFIAGMATSPTMITGMGLVQELIPRSQINEGMTLAVTSLLGGSSLGSMLAGWSVEHFDAENSYLLPVSAATLALLTAAAGLGRLRRSVSATQTPALTKDTAELGQQV
ncbi:MFS transporter [Streptomyces murinus]|uniref:MFS transporter n=1 Tax=Streptomyces murinus TaxID=33900 RepID=UPI000A1E510B|nr:MFS transporter [Streptomyces murinus]WDO09742.1 MFS transporter [Streptomyces murinus]